ncbi:hypothetical protein HYH03_007991 [Edaphochlamys debaryana]|uniref:3,4-dihydroxy-2-butanone-4-phosphate synthase n=1 Tax=Edaphochlamys debaryana TaxID=47281 RepID=A0A835Y0Z9_9CHLO|nr:hypothetical protein HYH03_007991 [Edaphochlamys debaryana]|eukprot:KAG2493770.1 hypothetical protein HYH03_007991 [Edaphochlamys debaryana]
MLARCPAALSTGAPAAVARPVPVLAPARVGPSPSRTSSAQPTVPISQPCSQLAPGAIRGCSVVARGQANSSLSLPTNIDLEQPLPGFDPISVALRDLAAGKLVVVLDDEDRENEGDLIMNADKVTPETMAFLVEYTSGVVCIAMEGSDLDRLRLPLMVSSAENEESMYTAFTITVDLRDGITTGISASDRAKTIRRLADPEAVSGDFRRPGHIFPLRYRPGGVLVRPGHTEAAVDLARLSGSFPAGVLCEVVNKQDGSMARTPELLELAQRHNMACITIADLIRYRLRHDALVEPAGEPTPLATRSGAKLTAHAFRSLVDGAAEHLALVHGAVADSAADVLVHVHHERTVADLLDVAEPGTSGGGPSLDAAVRSVAQAGAGVVVYLRGQAARGVQPSAELAALGQHGSSADLYGTDLKDAATAAQILKTLGVRSVALTTEDPALVTALRSLGLGVRVAAAGAGGAAAPTHINGNGNGHVRGSQPSLQAAGMR